MSSLAPPRRWESYFWPLLTLALFLAFWHGAVIWTHTKVFPSPLAIGKGLAELARKGVLLRYTADSLRRVSLGFAAAALVGIPLGLTLGWYPAANRVVDPVFQMLRPISPLAWIPVAILLFGVGETTSVFLIFLAAFFPIVVACVSGAGSVPTMHLRAARNFGLNPIQILLRVVFPAALPRILTGLRIALGVAWLVVVAAEMIAVDSGLGYLVIDARNSGKRYDLVVGAMLLIGLIGLALDFSFRRLGNLRVVRWGLHHEH